MWHKLSDLGAGKAFLSRTKDWDTIKEAFFSTHDVNFYEAGNTINRFETQMTGWETVLTAFIRGNALLSTRDKELLTQ